MGGGHRLRRLNRGRRPQAAQRRGLPLRSPAPAPARALADASQPYDCGFFYTRTGELLQRNLRNAAPYLTAPPSPASPLDTHLENSRRFRALPVYSTLVAYGAQGYRDLVRHLVSHAREIARIVYRHPAFELLPREAAAGTEDQAVERVFMVVLFRARDEAQNQMLRERINSSGRMYVSATVWDGKPAIRCAVGNWRVASEKTGPAGWGVVEEVLQSVGGGML